MFVILGVLVVFWMLLGSKIEHFVRKDPNEGKEWFHHD
jgi:hypothetical protein